MTNTFDADSWQEGARRTDAARERWEQETWSAVQSSQVTGDASVPVDAAVEAATTQLHLQWYDRIGNVTASLGSDASKMSATGLNYAATEDEAVAANDRFWSSR